MRTGGNFIEIECTRLNKGSNEVCGDSFMSRKHREGGRIICVLSDGLGSGIKASVLSTITASMAVNFSALNEDILSSAKTIIRTLPIDSVRKVGYATFTICDIDIFGNVRVAEYESPSFLLFRGTDRAEVKKERILVERDDMQDTFLWISEFRMGREDRIVFFSDGVSQSGMGSRTMPFGWESGIEAFAVDAISAEPLISARDLSRRIVARARENDGFTPKDDISCCVAYARRPRNILVCTGPPFHKKTDRQLAARITGFDGRKVVCGGTTAQILSRELESPLEIEMDDINADLPPASRMEGVDLVTEGILTLSKVVGLLEDPDDAGKAAGPSARLKQMLLDSDKVTFLVGTRINQAHQDPSLPVELEIRRNVIKKIKALLEERYLKDVEINYI